MSIRNVLLGVAMSATCAAAYAEPAVIRQFYYGLGSVFDNFNDGMPPPSGPFGPNNYSVSGGATHGAEPVVAGGGLGALLLDPVATGVPSSGVTGAPLLWLNTIWLSSRDSSNAFALREGATFLARGLFEATVPDPYALYGIRLQNFTTFSEGGSEVVSLSVRRDAGDPYIELRQSDFENGTTSVIDLDPIPADLFDLPYLFLALDHQADAKAIQGRYCFSNSTSSCSLGAPVTMSGFGTLFEVTDWTQASFYAGQFAQPVPEPASIALLTLAMFGLWALGYRRRA